MEQTIGPDCFPFSSHELFQKFSPPMPLPRMIKLPENLKNLVFSTKEPVSACDLPDPCAICISAHKSPITLVACRHSFCELCFSKWIKVSVCCPLCKTRDIRYIQFQHQVSFQKQRLSASLYPRNKKKPKQPVESFTGTSSSPSPLLYLWSPLTVNQATVTCSEKDSRVTIKNSSLSLSSDKWKFQEYQDSPEVIAAIRHHINLLFPSSSSSSSSTTTTATVALLTPTAGDICRTVNSGKRKNEPLLSSPITVMPVLPEPKKHACMPLLEKKLELK
jgi:hypothetical protein